MQAAIRPRIELIVRQSCELCRKVHTELEQFSQSQVGIDLQVFDLDQNPLLPEGRQAFITPAVWVNGVLWSLGRVDIKSLQARLKQIDGNTNPISA